MLYTSIHVSICIALGSVTWYFIWIPIFDAVFCSDAGNRIHICRVCLNQVTEHLDISVDNNQDDVIIKERN